ncbi:LacI family DNA-binding transcriptional regulator [Thermoflavimicrobium dichotomicum]|uniref:LacI family transcriptional regulator n=1 Tax=Thermoflavimicrobium dichotomicum TaxID=46223 RepID=A0A1I3V0D7_9BACL|nr:LacI family DNA-binding transcriptional regulator [Thermoflavimicrobium dichotomicum]SFJ88409.1 LacI family transcriptional regulator [Thermoflavimicrobium dichotomicum]
MKPTIYDVAREAGVSIATVSKVINNTGRISEKTRQKVLKVMKQLDYQPSILASALTGKHTYTIGLLIPDIANPFFAELSRRVEDRGQELGFSVVMCSTDNDPDKTVRYITLLKQKSVDGIILASSFENHQVLKGLLEENFPIALISQEIPSLAIDSVTVDDFLGGYQVTEYLLQLGHQKIAIVAEKAPSNQKRMDGYRKAIADANVEMKENYMAITQATVEGGYHCANQLFDLPEPPTAIFACNDLIAIGVIKAARERNLKIPNDLSVVGFDNTFMAEMVDPPLSSVQQPICEMSRQVVDLLVKKIQGEKSRKRVVLLPELVVRKSTMPPEEQQ